MCDCEKLIDTFLEANKLHDTGLKDEAFDLYTKFIESASKCVVLETNNDRVVELRKKLSLGYNNRGFIQYNRVDFDDAVADYSEALKLDDKLHVAYYNRGLIHYRLGRFEQAIEDMKKALQIKPDFAPAQSCLDQAYVDKLSKEKRS